MYLVGFLLLATPVVFVALLALAIDVTARKSRERKAVDEVVQTRLTDGNLGDVGELSCEKQRQGSNVVRVWACSIVCVSVFLFERIDA